MFERLNMDGGWGKGASAKRGLAWCASILHPSHVFSSFILLFDYSIILLIFSNFWLVSSILDISMHSPLSALRAVSAGICQTF
jgi:hypothetical protein